MKNFNFKIAGRDYTTKVEEQENGTLLVTVNGKTYEVNMPEQAHAIHKTIARPAAAATTPAAPSATPAAAKANTMSAPLPGTITKIVAQKGQKVKKGDRLVRLSDGTTLAAEFDGEVCALEAEKGEEVRAGDSLVQVADTDHMRVSFRIGESDIRDVAVGQDVRVTVASQGAAFTSKIESIDYVSYTGNNVAYYPATVLVDTSGNADVHNGMQATITVPQEEASDVVILKMDAVSTSADNSAFVYKQAEDGSMVETPVTVGVSNGNYVEIKSGVAAGETVYAVVKQEEESTVGGILAGLFGSQQVNAPSGRTPSGRNGGSSPSGNYYPGGGSNQPGSRNRGD